MNAYQQKLSPLLKSHPDFEERLDLLRTFTRDETKQLQNQDISQKLSLSALFQQLTLLAEAVLYGSHEAALEEVLKKYPAPKGGWTIVAMGKFGGRELTYHSDLDIIYLYEDSADQEFYTRLATRIISALTAVTPAGYAYQIDTALRPSGRGGTLVSSLSSFEEYHRTLGQIWERQSLIKARPLEFGNKEFTKKTTHVCAEISYQDYDSKQTAAEIVHLRGRMEKEIARERPGHYNLKTGRGGIVDIEFLAQYLQLLHGKKTPEVRTPNTLEALAALSKAGKLDTTETEFLQKAYLFYRELETRLRLVEERSTGILIEAAPLTKQLSERFFQGRDISQEYYETREKVRNLYEKHLVKA